MGRRRKTSNSTVATGDGSVKYVRETNLIRPATRDEIDDTSFIIQDATVYDKHGNPADLLTVIFHGPFTVRGFLPGDDEELESRLLKPNSLPSYVEIRDCVRYSVGQDNDETPCIWAEGRSGWYEIRPPSFEYTNIYNKMSEAVALYYAMLDIHINHLEKQKKPKKGDPYRDLSLDAIFFQYAVMIGDGSVKEDVIRRCNEMAPFLICHFYQDKDFDWEPTPFFKWLVGQHRNIQEKVLENERKKKLPATGLGVPAEPMETAVVTAPVEPTLPSQRRKGASETLAAAAVGLPVRSIDYGARMSFQTRNGSDDAEDDQLGLRGSRVKSTESSKLPELKSPSDPQPLHEERMEIDDAVEVQNHFPDEESTIAALRSLVGAINEIRTESGRPASEIKFSTISSKLFFKCKIRSYQDSKDILIYYARALMRALNDEVWSGSPFYEMLQKEAQGAPKPPTNIPIMDIPNQCLRRKESARHSTNTRPGVSKRADKRLPFPESETLGDSQGESSSAGRPKRGRPSGKMSGLRLAGTSKKRYTSQEDVDYGGKASKVAKRSHFFEDDQDETMEDGTSSDDEEEDEDESVGDSTPVKVVIRAEKLPSVVAKGPDGTWVCEQEDCGYVIRGADKDEGQERAYEHLRFAHSQPDEDQVERISLAMTESRGHIPIDHLLEKLRKVGEKVQKSERLEIDGTVVPQPIKRRLIV